MILSLIRQPSTPKGTPGTLLIDGTPFCSTLEPPYGWASGPAFIGGQNTLTKENAPKGRIPDGTYRLRLTYSPKFKRILPLVDLVPGFEGIRIHPGNTLRDTRGCILVGRRFEPYSLGDSRLTLIDLMEQLLPVQNAGETILIEVGDEAYLEALHRREEDPMEQEEYEEEQNELDPAIAFGEDA